MTTKEIFNRYNFNLLCDIMDKDFGVIECNSVVNPNDEVFHQPINNQNNTTDNVLHIYDVA